MTSKGEIKSEKILIKDIFSNMWFRIPEYQRPYVWGRDEVNDLLDDLSFAMTEKPDFEYFMGSFVFQSKKAAPEKGQDYIENDLLDGQQRMSTLLMLFGVLRDLSNDPDAKVACQECIFQKASTFKKIPERTRLIFAIRDTVQDFIDRFIKTEGGTLFSDDLQKEVTKSEDISVKNMADAILVMHDFFVKNDGDISPENLLQFLLNNVLLIYVATEDLEDAFRLFTILNDRGIPLRNSDILKSMNLGALESKKEKDKYAKLWEEAEGELGEDFDRFLNYLRTVLVKDKARLNLLREFEDKIYDPKEKDKATGLIKPVLLKKGKETFELVERYLGHYQTLISGNNHSEIGSFEFDNLIKVMLTGLPATDWMPPLLKFFEKFEHNEILEFLTRLDNKFSADWIGQYSPTDRIEAMNSVIRVIEQASEVNEVFESNCFDIDVESFVRRIQGQVYGKRFARYLLLKLDFLYQNHDQKMNFETLSVEHILPQNPNKDSQWVKDFSEEERVEWTNKLGNLVLITLRKNTSQGRLDYPEKKKRYFQKRIDTCPNSLRVLNEHTTWTLADLAKNHETVLRKLQEYYKID